MTTLRDPNHRRETFHVSPLGETSSTRDAQQRRREIALLAQKQRRTHAIEAARSKTSQALNDIEDLTLADASSDSDDNDQPPPPTNNSLPLNDNASPPTSPKISKTKRKQHKPTFKSWAKNLLSHAETLDLRYGLPEGFERDWRLSVVPKGKRCLAATTNDSAGKNTILYSRVAGRTLGRFHSILPPDCLLDVIWDPELSVLWVLDMCKWRSLYTVEYEAEFRAFFTTSKLAELETQFYVPPPSSSTSTFESITTSPSNPSTTNYARESTSRNPLLILPCPTYSSPLIPSTVLPILNSLSTPSILPVQVYTPTSSSSPQGSTSSQSAILIETIQVPFEATGVLLYLTSAHYESGTTPLVNWVPILDRSEIGTEEGRARSRGEGVERLKELVEEWERRGGEAAGERTGGDMGVESIGGGEMQE